MTDTADYTIAAPTPRGPVVIAEVTHTDPTAVTGQVEHIDPNAIEVETNIRTVVKLDPAFVASIRTHGVLQPVLCRRGEHGTITVRAGQRRVLAAREAGRLTVPAYIVEGDDATVTRLVEQFAENEHRAGLTQTERAAVFQQLKFEGLSVAQIAKRTGAKRQEVTAGIAVASNDTAAALTTRHALTLDQAAALIDFEDDADTTAHLVEVAETEPGQFPHALQRAADDKKRRELIEQARATLTEQGWTVLDARPSYDDRSIVARRAITKGGKPITDKAFQALGAARAAFVTLPWGDEPNVNEYVIDPEAHGFDAPTVAGPASGPMTDEQKAERKTLIANNKAWTSAEVVRREWLSALLSRKTLPKDAAAFVARALTEHRHTVGAAIANGNEQASALLGLTADRYRGDELAEYARTPGKSAHLALAVTLGGIEGATSRNNWRNPTASVASYLSTLEAWGYTLSDVERIVVDAVAKRNATPDVDNRAQED